MRLSLRYEREGVSHEVTTNLAVIVAWERKFRAKAAQLANQIGAEDLLFLAFEASKRQGVTVPGPRSARTRTTWTATTHTGSGWALGRS